MPPIAPGSSLSGRGRLSHKQAVRKRSGKCFAGERGAWRTVGTQRRFTDVSERPQVAALKGEVGIGLAEKRRKVGT